jgi:hypothetical protein
MISRHQTYWLNYSYNSYSGVDYNSRVLRMYHIETPLMLDKCRHELACTDEAFNSPPCMYDKVAI